MKINKLDAHDRLLHYNKHDFDIGECCQDLINKRPFGPYPFYIFAHPRTDDDGVTKRLIWQPRLTKPKAQTNSMLFKAWPGNDNIKVIWMIPAEELWGQYAKGLLTESKIVGESIYNYQHRKEFLESPEPDDFDDMTIDSIYRQLAREAKTNRVSKQVIVEPC
jgi:hypothetical protein